MRNNKLLILSLFILLFLLSASSVVACTATTSCNACGKNYVASDSIDCHCACDDGRGNCVDPGCDAECDRDADGCPTGSVTASCKECGGGGDDTLPTPTACPNPPPPTLSSPASGSTFILPSAPAQLFVDQVIRGISQSCGPNTPEYNMTFSFVGATFEKGWNSSLTWHTGPYGRTGTVNWKAKSRYLDSPYSTYRESVWTSPWTYQVVTPTPIPTCDSEANSCLVCYTSTRPSGSCQEANLRVRTTVKNLGNSRSSVNFEVRDSNNTLIDSGGPYPLDPNGRIDTNHTHPPQNPDGTWPDYGIVYCGSLTLKTSCSDKPDINALNNQRACGPILPCSPPTPTATPTPIPTLDAWFQTQEGDVHAGKNINSAIPTTAPNRNFSLFGLTGSPGIISYNGQEPNFGCDRCYPSSNDPHHWVVKTLATNKYFSYFYSLLGSPTTANFNGGNLPRDTGVYYGVGNITISGIEGGSVGSSKSIVVLVRGTLSISTDIEIPEFVGVTPLKSSLVVIVYGDINIANSVNRLDGVFVADGTIDTGAADKQLRVQGAFISSGSVNFGRNLGTDNEHQPAELFVNRPDFFINSHPLLWRSSFASWQELIP